ncbi:Fatty-acid-binding protein 1 [Gracilariopsis chorda]|uniref:Fatty-acid-binding protein 1 n=1 Tax=Gracilariopsis chorda TaxID=448386 RepID=A0A2V3IZ37_9FLOR|nr:Fatty-acid-binding protein 1 [Gracilariopsis chorda]|eukprot:PXF47335.1 Fatty-acid-binding protein 1 [Gracilariopsis chorda]
MIGSQAVNDDDRVRVYTAPTVPARDEDGLTMAWRALSIAARRLPAVLRPLATLRTNAESNALNPICAQSSSWTAASSYAALLSAASFAGVVYADQPFTADATSRVEHDTGVHFPTTISSAQQLVGVGARFMRGLVKVYAVGVYLDAVSARHSLRNWSGFDVDDILEAQPLWNALVEGAPALGVRTVRMVVVRQVVGSHMQHGFERQLIPRVLHIAKRGGCRPADCKADAKRFCALFCLVGTMKVGSDVRIAVDADVVSLSVDGRVLGEVRSKQLAVAVMDMFLGDRSVVNGLRRDVAVGLHQWLL